MELVACDLCGGESAEVVAQQTDLIHRTTKEYFTIVRCNGCGLCYTNPRPSVTEIGRYYANEYPFFQRYSSLRQLARTLLVSFANSRVAPLASVIPRLSQFLAVRVMPHIDDPVRIAMREGVVGGLLDVGCGSGHHANFWGHHGSLMSYRRALNVDGVEVSEDARRVLESFGIRAWPDISVVPADRRWSIIRLNWSLEHVHRPSEFLEFSARHLAPGGRVIICVPNYAGPLYKLAPDAVELPIHLYHFTPTVIAAYAAKYGFEVRNLETFSYPEMFFTAVRLGMLDARFGANEGVANARRFQAALSRFDRAGYGNDMIAVLERAGA